MVCRREGRRLLAGGVSRRRDDVESRSRASTLRSLGKRPDMDVCALRNIRDDRLLAACVGGEDKSSVLAGPVGDIIALWRRFSSKVLRRLHVAGRLAVPSVMFRGVPLLLDLKGLEGIFSRRLGVATVLSSGGGRWVDENAWPMAGVGVL
jgi:hypothetical protein